MFNGHKDSFAEDSVADLAYVAISDDISDLYALASDMDEVTVHQNGAASKVDPKTGNAIQ